MFKRSLTPSASRKRPSAPRDFRRRARPWLEVLEGRVLPVNSAVFLPPQGDWNVPANWNTGRVPTLDDAAFVINNTLATITSAVPDTTDVYIGQGSGNGTVQMRGGSLTLAGGIHVGVDNGRSGLWYQVAGTLDARTLTLGAGTGTQGKLVLDGGVVRNVQTATVGGSGVGGMTVGGGAFSAQDLVIAQGSGSNGSYFNEAHGTVALSGGVNVGSPGTDGLLVVSGGAFSWGGTVTVGGSGSSFLVEGSAPNVYWNSSGTTAALTVSRGGTLQFNLTPAGLPTLDLRNGLIDIGSGSQLVIDGSRFNFADRVGRTYTLATFGGYAGLTSFPSVRIVGLSNKVASVSYTSHSLVLTVGYGAAVDTTSLVTSDNLYLNAGTNYVYAPSFMYDETEGLYKVWSCYHDDVVPGGDNIGYKEYPTLMGMTYMRMEDAFPPSLDPLKFDQQHACDPSVYRDPTTGAYYLAYGGNLDERDPRARSRLGIAQSTDGGRTFAGLYNPTGELQALIWPGADYAGGYGVGQPAVVKVDDTWYMLYTDSPSTSIPGVFRVIRSSTPDFRTYTAVAALTEDLTGGPSLDLAYDPFTSQFIVSANTTPLDPNNIGYNNIHLSYFDRAWNYLGQQTITANTSSPAFSFGEGVGLLTNSIHQTLYPNSLSFAGGTLNRDFYPNRPWWVMGHLSYLTVVAAHDTGVAAFQTHGDGSLYALLTDGRLLRYGDGPEWSVLDTNVSTIVRHSDGSIYALHSASDPANPSWVRRWSGGLNWQWIDTNVLTIAPQGDGSVYALHSTSDPANPSWVRRWYGGLDWQWVDNNVQAIAAHGDGSIYALHSASDSVRPNAVLRWSAGPTWQEIDEHVQAIAAHGDGSIYALHSASDPVRPNAVLRWSAGPTWQWIDSNVQAIAAHGDGSIYALHNVLDPVRPTAVLRWSGGLNWQPIDANVQAIAAHGDGSIYTLHNALDSTNPNAVLRWSGGLNQQRIDANVQAMAAHGDGSIYTLHSASDPTMPNVVLRWFGGVNQSRIDDNVLAIAANGDGSIYTLHSASDPIRPNAVLRWFGGVNQSRIDDNVQMIAAAGDGTVYALHNASDPDHPNTIRRWLGGLNWQWLDGNVQSIAGAADGSVYALSTNGMLSRWIAGTKSLFADNVQAFLLGPGGYTVDVLKTNGDLIQYSPAGSTLLAQGIRSISLDDSGFVLFAVDQNGNVLQFPA